MSDTANDGNVFPSVTIFELKRPMRDDYSSGENPIDQMYKYVEKLMTGNVKDRNGRYIKVDDRTMFYLYAI